MIASLPMYDRPEVATATDRFWSLIRQGLGEGPDQIDRDGDPWDHWRSPDLLLSQTCGYPYRACLHGKVRLVGTPDYGLPGCPPGYYNSVFVARADDTRDTLPQFDGACFAYNEPLSQSGWAAPITMAMAEGVAMGETVQTGGHLFSARAVAEGRAELAALDALSWKMMQAHDPVAAHLREVVRTPPTPTLPYITALSRDAARIARAVEAAIVALRPADREALSLRGLVQIAPETYLAVPNPPPPT